LAPVSSLFFDHDSVLTKVEKVDIIPAAGRGGPISDLERSVASEQQAKFRYDFAATVSTAGCGDARAAAG